jgi:hypothetical protein
MKWCDQVRVRISRKLPCDTWKHAKIPGKNDTPRSARDWHVAALPRLLQARADQFHRFTIY